MSDQQFDDYSNEFQKLFETTMETARSTMDMGKIKSLTGQALTSAERTHHAARNKIIALGFLGQCYESQGWKDDAAKTFDQALSLLKDVTNLHDLTLATTLQHIAFYYLGGRSEFEAAVTLQRTASELLDQMLPTGDRDRAFAFYRLGELLYCDDQNEEAEAALNTALDSIKVSDEPDSTLMVMIVELLGDNFKDMRQFDEAERYYQHAFSMVQEFLPDRGDLLDRIANRVKTLRASRNA